VTAGIVGWITAAARPGSAVRLRAVLTRDPRPFVPLLLLIAIPRFLVQGPGYLVEIPVALPSGVGQQLLLLVGLFAALEAVTGRADVAAVASALVFGFLHVPFNLPANGGDWVAASANAIFYQATVGIICCLAFVRHRAPLSTGFAHALAIA
jgi:hypothetical protein